MRLARGLAAALTAVVLVAGVASCSAAAPHQAPAGRTVPVASGVDVTFRSAFPPVRARAVPGATGSLTAPVRVGSESLPSAIEVLAPAQHLMASGKLPAGGAVITFRVNPRDVPAGTTPFLASLDPATGLWVPAPSHYDPATGQVSAHTSHFSIWAPLDWARPRIAALLEGALTSLFGLAGTGSPPACPGTAVTVTDSRPRGGIGACAQPDGAALAAARITDERPYPVDLLYPASATIDAASPDPFAQLGADLTNLASNWHDRVLLTGGGTADATVPLPAGHAAELVTELDGEALLAGILGTAITMLVKITGGVAATTAKNLLDAMGKARCLAEAAATASTASLSPDTARAIGSAAFDCLAAVAKGIGDVIFTVAIIIASLATELTASTWAAIDSALGNSYHVLTLRRQQAVTVYIAQDADIYNPPLYRPATAGLAGDGTYELTGMTWSTWSGTTAVGTGTALIDDCNPACGGGHFYRVPVVATFSHPVRACKAQPDSTVATTRYFWSQATLTYPSGLPPALHGYPGEWNFPVAMAAQQSCGGSG
jgi:hypothetical protein